MQDEPGAWMGHRIVTGLTRFEAGPNPLTGPKGPENALRDPTIFVEQEGRYLVYSVAGEFGIAIPEIAP